MECCCLLFLGGSPLLLSLQDIFILLEITLAKVVSIRLLM